MKGVSNSNKFSKELKKQAVKEYVESNKPLSTIAKKYGVSTSSLQRWVNEQGEICRRKGAPEKHNMDTMQQAVADYLAGKGSLRMLAAQYGIENASLLLYHVKKSSS